ncbi:bifunctional salicylyl-CoA 5-hydroxylase/oxidoreductase [Caulobacter sp. S45]|uniref:bifunctional salicylyl-CoA 5-hydroxylase/oxidoreductase n=1 Tax=Caulobacter sp. S45 TaxID=1641861 RepID=UPI00131A9228|nr:bifunctional salicylyl-CoA 5-hydroxylase/oxidoreductase [Caulobacter sp. S45]
MKISIIGGGPAGLYFAILMKAAKPELDICIYERNRPDDTFGFGVVFSDQTLDTFAKYDAPSHRAITENFSYWDDIEIHFKGETIRVGGNGFCGCSRQSLLKLMQQRAEALGVRMDYQTDIEDLSRFADSDLIVAADGINSRVRTTYEPDFGTSVDLRPNKFAWMGSTKPLDAFTFYFRETPYGVFIAHCYQYEAGRSTWVIETDPDTFDRAGLEQMSEEASAAFIAEVFAEELDGHQLITNRSLWRSFPMIRNAHWVRGNVVLLGDAKATAHFSIGSGTKLAMEDAIALFEAFKAEPAVDKALYRFEHARREDVEKTQHAADVSLVWFEHLKRFWDYDPVKFSFGLMTRSKAITYDNLAVRAPEFVDRVARHFAEEQAAKGLPVRDPSAPPMFQPFRLRELELSNRVVLSPMCTYSAEDGTPDDWHLVHLGARALGGAGLIFTEMTDVSPEARITPGCTGLYTDEQETAWKRVVDFVHQASAAKICLQLGHAGRKGATRLMWEGMDQPLESNAWPLISASPLPYYPHSQPPREMTRADMDAVKADFVAATRRAEKAGFDMLEMHCAHGYLLASFVSPLTNHRTDEYGGSLENRLRYPLEVFEAMRDAWPAHKPMSVRISATDWKDGGISGEDSVEIARSFSQAGCDLIDVSTGQTVHDAAPMFGRMFQTPFADRIRNEAQVATMCVGAISSADQINTILAAGRADLVAVGRGHLADPFMTVRAAAWYGVDLPGVPPQYAPGVQAEKSSARKAREELLALRIRAKPKGGGVLTNS